MTLLEAIQTDITTLKVDAIVNAANTTLLGGGGVDGAIHRAAGPRLLAECKTLGGCETGEARMTKGYDLPAQYVIHTVGPVWNGGNRHEAELLTNCYENSLRVAMKNNIKVLAFPSISTGAYRFPFKQAASIAVDTVRKFTTEHPVFDKVIFVCFKKEDWDVYQELLARG